MSLNSRTIAKILREHFTGETPLRTDVHEQQTLNSSIKAKLKTMKGVSISSSYHYAWKKVSEQECEFSIKDDSSYRSNYFTIKFDEINQLLITHYNDTAIVYQIEQIYTLIDRLHLEYEKKKGRQQKTEKINKLKQLAIIGNIKQIAKEDKFDFYTIEYSTKLKLSVRIENYKIIEIDIPYKKFQDILKDLRSLIQTIRELQKSGINFKLKTDSARDSYGWITHESL